MSPTCSVVVCTRSRPDQLGKCLQAISNVSYSNFDVVVVDNGDENERIEHLAERWNAKYVREPVIGVSRARNRGARSCGSEIVAFIDDDAIPDSTWLSNLVEEFRDPTVMAVTGRIEPLNQNAYGDVRPCARGRDKRRLFDAGTRDWFALANFGGVGDGANMAFRRKAFEIWPGFDVRLGLGGTIEGSDEHNAFFELIQRGSRIVFTPAAIVYHPFPTTLKEARARSFRNLRAAFAYMTLLFVEQPRYRIPLARFLARSIFRRILGKATNVIHSRRHELVAIAGSFEYWSSRHDHRRGSPPLAADSNVIKTLE